MLTGMDELIILSALLLSGVGLAWRLESRAIRREEAEDLPVIDRHHSVI